MLLIRILYKLHYDEKWLSSDKNPNKLKDMEKLKNIDINDPRIGPMIFQYSILGFENL